MIHTLHAISPLFLIIALGYVLARTRLAQPSWTAVFNAYSLNIGFPVLIFMGMTKITALDTTTLPLIYSNSLFLIGTFVLAMFLGFIFRLSKQQRRTLIITIMFSNIAFLGIPVITRVWGDPFLPQVSLIAATYLFWVFTLGLIGIELIRGKFQLSSLISLLKNPLLIAVICGILWNITGLVLPKVMDDTLTLISESVTGVVLLSIGIFVGLNPIGRWRDWLSPFYFSLTTLLVLPALFWGAITLLGLPGRYFSPSIIEAAMPLAVTPYALASQYALNESFIVRSIVLSTLLSLITLPGWIIMLT